MLIEEKHGILERKMFLRKNEEKWKIDCFPNLNVMIWNKFKIIRKIVQIDRIIGNIINPKIDFYPENLDALGYD